MLAAFARRLFGRAAGQTPSPEPIRAATLPPASEAMSPVPAATPPTRLTTRRRRRPVEPVVIPAKLLARRLLVWCQTKEPLELLHEELLEVYEVMCHLDGLVPLPWRDVGAELRRLLGGRKTYAWVIRAGRRQRLRVYRIPPATGAAPAMPAGSGLRRAA